MPPVSFLDDLVNRFRHRWEIDRQFRAAASGVVGLVVIVALCSCAGIASTMANSVFAGSGLAGGGGGGGGPQSQDTTTLKGFAGIPTQTIPPWTPGSLPPAPPAPTSATQAPSPTAPPTATPRPTATPCQSNCGGGPKPPISWRVVPSTLSPGTAQIIVTTTPGDIVAVQITWQPCQCDYNGPTDTPTDASGNATITFAVPAAGNIGTFNVFARDPNTGAQDEKTFAKTVA